MASKDLDGIDRSILEILQADGRITNQELASRIGLSPRACLDRVRKLERSGLISGYMAVLDPRRIGAPMTIVVEVTLKDQTQATHHRFEQRMRQADEVVECFLVSGPCDYVLRLACRDLDHYRESHQRVDRRPDAGRRKAQLQAGAADDQAVPRLPAGLTPRHAGIPSTRCTSDSAESTPIDVAFLQRACIATTAQDHGLFLHCHGQPMVFGSAMNTRVGQFLDTGARSIALEQRYAAPNYAPLPVVLERGDGCWLWDAAGRRYLDFMSAYSAVSHGHAHPRLVRALVEQAQQLAVASRAYHSTALGPFLAALVDAADLLGPTRALPASGGCESVETAIKAARRWGYRSKRIAADRATIAVARGNFHGRSTTVVGFSTEPDYRADFGPFAPGFRHFDFGDIASLAAVIDETTCAVLLEPIQGEAGIVVPPDGYLAAVRRLCDERGVLLILDEIQSGLGRTGAMFAYMHEHIRPDGVIVGKALGGGLLPVSAFVARAAVLDHMGPGSHGSTFGGNPLAARVGLEALRVILDERLVERSRVLGGHLLDRLRALQFRSSARCADAGCGRESNSMRAMSRLASRRTHGRARRAHQGHARDGDPLCAAAHDRARAARLGHRRVRRRAARSGRRAGTSARFGAVGRAGR